MHFQIDHQTPRFIHEVSACLSAIQCYGETHPLSTSAIADVLAVAPPELQKELAALVADVEIMPGQLECRLQELLAEHEAEQIISEPETPALACSAVAGQ